ncbi:MAG: hypothetical protein ACI4NG_00625 [Candidatus Gallimonas sp.]
MKGKLAAIFRNPTIRAVAIGALALLLLFAVQFAFFGKSETQSYAPTEEETRLCALLEKIEGVKEVTVMVSRTETVGAVVIFGGEDSLLTRLRILEATATALGADRKNVKIYPAEGA